VEESDLQHSDRAVIVALGSNLPGPYASPAALIEAALVALCAAGLTVVRRSGLWRSAAWPDPSQPQFINAVALVETAMSPKETLSALHALEARFGRQRIAANAPRPLDLDLIAYGRLVLEDGDLGVPHARAAERLFVMGPLAEIAPDWTHPVSGETAKALAQRATVGADARRVQP
jgi:2-amino-4-hydroxy-6-hydroxymethyldihydropteridine diphosphokinase